MGGKPATSEAAKDVAEAADAADHGLDPADPAVTGVPRDERHDSIDPHNGLLTEEAQQLRREAAQGGESEG